MKNKNNGNNENNENEIRIDNRIQLDTGKKVHLHEGGDVIKAFVRRACHRKIFLGPIRAKRGSRLGSTLEPPSHNHKFEWTEGRRVKRVK